MNRELGLRAQQGRHQLYRDQSLLITAPDGEVREAIEGFYYANTRLLSRFGLRSNGRALMPVQVAPAGDRTLVAYYQDPRLTNDETAQDRALILQLTITLGSGFHVDVDARNHSLLPIVTQLELLLASDFADLDEPRSGKRLLDAEVRRTCMLPATSEMRFDCLQPGLDEHVRLEFSTPPDCREEGVAWELTLAPQAAWHSCIELVPTHEGREIRPVAGCYGAISDGSDDGANWTRKSTRVSSSNDSVVRSYDRAVQDLGSLALNEGPREEHAAFAAGIPFYQNPFGRDLLTTSWQALLAASEPIESAVRLCARTQGKVVDDFRDEQPGRIIQQLRSGPLNLLNINPRGRYYSDYASPGDFLVALGQHFMWTGDKDFFRQLLPSAERVLHWLDSQADLDGDGFYEYKTRSPQGDRNQGWKDSDRAIPNDDGTDASLPLATCEVQGYVYAGKQQLGAAMLALGQLRAGMRLLGEASDLKRRFNHAFWMPQERFIALALDGQKRQVRSIASNAGHCLATGIVDRSHASAVAGRLMAPDMFSGWGVRTLSAAHPAYNPFSYHLGSVWTVEQATIAFGLKRYGFGVLANDLARGTFELAERFELHRLPEAVGGQQRDRMHPIPGLYPKACWPQAWSSGAIILLLQAILGLRPIAPAGVLLVYPELPDWLPDLTLENLRIGNSRLTIRFHREPDGSTGYRVVERSGRVRVLLQPPDNSVRHSPIKRILDAAGYCRVL